MRRLRRDPRGGALLRQCSTVALTALLLSLGGCATRQTSHRDWSHYDGPGARYFKAEEVELPELQADPLEPLNRAVSLFNDELITRAIAPLARAYRWAVPRIVRESVARASLNLEYPKRLVNNVLQGKFAGAYDETRRFAINSTAGIAGFFDPASELGIEASAEDAGQTLGRWGWGDSSFLALPILGPSSVRDGVGLTGDAFIAPEGYFLGIVPSGSIAAYRVFNAQSDSVDFYSRFLQREYDPYALTRDLYGTDRHRQVVDYRSRRGSSDDDTLRAAFFGFSDPEFPNRAQTVRTPLGGDRVAIYDQWLQPEPAPLVIVLPGLGGHRQSDLSLGLAESAFLRGCSVVTVSSTMNWEFIESSAAAALPGYPKADIDDVIEVLRAILASIEDRHPGATGARTLMGVSLGAFQTLLVAAADTVAFESYIAINPPVRLLYGMEQLDTYFNAPLAWDAARRQERVRQTLMTALELGRGGFAPSGPMPFTEIQAKFLIGLAFRLGLRDAVFATQLRRNLGVLQTPLDRFRRQPVYDEIARYSFMEYLYAFLLPDLIATDPAVDNFEQVEGSADLRSVETELRRQRDRVFVFTNRDDFLLAPHDISWLEQALDEHLTLFDDGGHLGNLHDSAVRSRMLEPLAGGPTGM